MKIILKLTITVQVVVISTIMLININLMVRDYISLMMVDSIGALVSDQKASMQTTLRSVILMQVR
jgi:hypothetical protein